MDFLRFSFDYSPFFIPLCLALGLVYAYLLYSRKSIWSRLANRTLFALRAFLVAFIAFLLIGPALQFTVVEQEKPSLLVLVDNSSSVREAVDSVAWQAAYSQLQDALKQLNQQGFDTPIRTLDNKQDGVIRFTHTSSDINGATQRILEEYEGKNLAGLLVISDGIYNSGISPLYSSTKAPIYTLGMGDTTQYVDVRIKNVAYNKIVHQGNFFPLHVETLTRGVSNQAVTVMVYHKGKQIARETKNAEFWGLAQFSFEIEATEKGLQQFEVVVESLPEERNTKNNRLGAYIEVIGGKKKILLIAPAPHPDNKAIRAVVAKNTNYELDLYIPGVHHTALAWQGKRKPDVVILRYAPDEEKMMPLLDSVKKYSIPLFIMFGEVANSQQWETLGIPISFEQSLQRSEVHPILNLNYKNFNLPNKLSTIFAQYPPVHTSLGKIYYPPNADILLFQHAAGAKKNQPLLLTFPDGDHITAILFGENVWRWRMSEFAEYGSTEGFDLLFSKLIQYLGVQENRQRFRSFPLQDEFTIADPILFESQVYNNLFEPIYGYPIALELTDERGKSWSYRYVVGPNRSQYTLGPLEEGVYQYRSSTTLEGQKKTVEGRFRVTAQHIESQNLTANFTLLKEWARRTGGIFYTIENSNQLALDFESKEAVSLPHSETSFNLLINLKWAFVLLLLLISTEWIIRKFLGGY